METNKDNRQINWNKFHKIEPLNLPDDLFLLPPTKNEKGEIITRGRYDHIKAKFKLSDHLSDKQQKEINEKIKDWPASAKLLFWAGLKSDIAQAFYERIEEKEQERKQKKETPSHLTLILFLLGAI
jgi:hypothetical protein